MKGHDLVRTHPWSEEQEAKFQKALDIFKETNGRLPTLEEESSLWELQQHTDGEPKILEEKES